MSKRGRLLYAASLLSECPGEMPAGVLVMPRVVKPALFETVREKRTYLHINIESVSNCEIRCPAIIINEQNIFINIMLNEKSKL